MTFYFDRDGSWWSLRIGRFEIHRGFRFSCEPWFEDRTAPAYRGFRAGDFYFFLHRVVTVWGRARA